MIQDMCNEIKELRDKVNELEREKERLRRNTIPKL